MARGACVGRSDVAWFPSRGEDTEPAKAICRGCPVLQECADFATRPGGERFGIWAGMSERERRGERRRRAEAGATHPSDMLEP